jgi:predicted RNA binding protein YcfA (HicA-like mRNA interferase family)
MKVKEMIEIIENDGWYLDRIKGSHRQFKHSVKKERLQLLENFQLICR